MTATGGSEAYGIGRGGNVVNAAGSFSTGDNGCAVIYTNSIEDTSDEANWSGIISISSTTGDAVVYGNPVITVDANIPSEKTAIIEEGKTVTIAEGVTFTINGTLYQGYGSTFTKTGTYTDDNGTTYYEIAYAGGLTDDIVTGDVTAYSSKTYATAYAELAVTSNIDIYVQKYDNTLVDMTGDTFTMPAEPVQIASPYEIEVADITMSGYSDYTVEGLKQTLVITNIGEKDVTISSVALSGDNADSFTLNNTGGTTVAAGATDNTTYTIQPVTGLAIGNYTANVTVTYDNNAIGIVKVLLKILPEPVNYIDADGVEQTYSGEYTTVTADMSTRWGTTGEETWYVLNSDVECTGVYIYGTVNLILVDGCKLTITSYSVGVTSSNTLNIYGQAEGTGELNSTTASRLSAGIGCGSNNGSAGTITINGGTVKATGGTHGAGIGGGAYSSGGTIIINGGTVEAQGGVQGAGIGGGIEGGGGTVIITGGTVTANGNLYSVGIGNGYDGSGGTFSTTDADGNPGCAVIFASSFDTTYDESEWSGIISTGGDAHVYGNPVITVAESIPSGNSVIIEEGKTVTIAEGVTFTNNGTIYQNYGSTFTKTGTYTDNGTTYYEVADITGEDGNTISGGTTYSSKTYAEAEATVSFTSSIDCLVLKYDGTSVDVNEGSFTMPNEPVALATPTYELEVEAPVFDEVTYGDAQPDAQPVTVTNTGNSTATITSVALSGDGASAFVLSKGDGTTIAVATTDSTTYTVQPAAGLGAGTHTATITVTYDGGTEATVEVSITVNNATMTDVSVSQSGTLTYTGDALTAEVATSATTVDSTEATFTYSTSDAEGSEYSADVPAFTAVGEHTVYYKATAASHDDANGEFIVTIAKATPDYTVPTDLTATEGQTLAQVSLPDGWSWEDDTQSMGSVGGNTFTAIYTPDDTDNYETVTADVTVTVTAATGISEVDAATTDDDVYYNLNGVRVNNPTRGIYIKNGEKVVIK